MKAWKIGMWLHNEEKFPQTGDKQLPQWVYRTIIKGAKLILRKHS